MADVDWSLTRAQRLARYGRAGLTPAELEHMREVNNRATAKRRDKKSAYDAAYREKHRDRIYARIYAYMATHKAEKSAYDRLLRDDPVRGAAIRAQKRRHHDANRERHNKRNQRSHIMRTFGISLEDKRAMLWAQGGACRLCRAPLDAESRHAHLDHDHATGRLRAVLCQRCNMGLGCFHDDPSLLFEAILYLEEFGIVPPGLGDDIGEHGGDGRDAGRLLPPLTA